MWESLHNCVQSSEECDYMLELIRTQCLFPTRLRDCYIHPGFSSTLP